MMRLSLFVVALTLACLATLGSSQAPSVPIGSNAQTICQSYSDEKNSVNLGKVFDILMVQYKAQIKNTGTELAKEYLKNHDADHDGVLSLIECQNLIHFLDQQLASQSKK